jgi:choline dehydrogenase
MEVIIPAAFPKQFRTKIDWDHNSEPEPNLKGRSLYLPRGKMLGGSSSMNAMIYIRGRRSDYDGWRDAGCDGWGYDDVLPYFKRSEHNERIRNDYHGVGGEMNVADQRHTHDYTLAFVEAAVRIGLKRNPDFNGAEQDGVGTYQVTQKHGMRHSTARAFLRPAMRRKNLTVETGAMVHRIVLDGNRAVGVEYGKDNVVHRAEAAAEVVLAAGAFGSPQLLMLSGIGPADHLRSHGITVVVDSPQVGRNLQDHPVVAMVWKAKRGPSLDAAEKLQYLLHYAAFRRGMLSSNVGEGGAFVRTRADLPAADIQYHFGPAYFVEHGFEDYHGDAFTIGPTLVTVKSRGRVELRSADPDDKPMVHGNYLDDPEDVASLVAGMELGREIARATPFDGLRGEEIYPGPEYSTPAELEEFARQRAELLYHPVATCAMGPGDAVCDPALRVRGVEGLRVADASVMPTVPGGNTNAPTIMIAEKAADLIREGR